MSVKPGQLHLARNVAVCNWPSGGTPNQGYDADGNLLVTRTVYGGTANSPCNGTTQGNEQYQYDDRGWPKRVVHSVHSPDFNGGQDITVSRTEEPTYRADGLLSTWKWSGSSYAGTTTTYGYSPGGYLEGMDDWRAAPATSHSSFTYFRSGAIKNSDLGSSASIGATIRGRRTYNPDGSLSSLRWLPADTPGAQPLRAHDSIHYYADGLLKDESVTLQPAAGASNADTGGLASYEYDALGRLSKWTSPFELNLNDGGPPVTTYTVDGAGNVTRELVQVAGSTRTNTTFDYSANNLLNTWHRPGAPDITFDYNGLGQEKERSEPNDQYLPWQTVYTTTAYDSAGNVIELEFTPTTNPSRASEGWRVDYDRTLGGSPLARTEDQGGPNGPRYTIYLRSSLMGRPAEETDGKGGTLARYLLSPDGQPLAQQTSDRGPTGDAVPASSTWTWLLTDSHGSIATLARDSGSGTAVVARQKSFDPYGKLQAKGTGPDDPDGPFGAEVPDSSFGYQTSFTDRVTKKLLLGGRQYDPEIDRFTSSDTYLGSGGDLQLAADPLTGNQFVFAAANPVAFFDDGHRVEGGGGGGPCNRHCPFVPPDPSGETGGYREEVAATAGNSLVSSAAEFFGVPRAVIAGVLEAERAHDWPTGAKMWAERNVVPQLCSSFVRNMAPCLERGVGPSQMQIRRALSVDHLVQIFLIREASPRPEDLAHLRATWDSDPSSIRARLNDSVWSGVYVAAFMGTKRNLSPSGMSWQDIYQTDTPGFGAYNARPVMVKQFEASRNYYSYLDS